MVGKYIDLTMSMCGFHPISARHPRTRGCLHARILQTRCGVILVQTAGKCPDAEVFLRTWYLLTTEKSRVEVVETADGRDTQRRSRTYCTAGVRPEASAYYISRTDER